MIELGLWVAGPAVGGLLADWGADVIKVEPPAGDPMRQVFGAVGLDVEANPPFELDNRGKRSIVLDLADAGARETMHALLETADVFVTNVRPDALERLGFDHEQVRARHPALIYCSVTGYGLNGPDRDRAGYDVGAFWARSGAASKLVPDGATPPTLRSGFGDHTTALAATCGVLAALVERQRTGEGRLVETSLLRTGIYAMGWDTGIFLRYGKLEGTRPRTKNRAPLVNCYQAADGKWFWLLGLEQQRHWPRTLAAMERTDLGADPRFHTAKSRLTHATELIEILDATFATRSRYEWTERFDAHDVWWAPVNTVPEVTVDPQAIASGAFVDMTPVDGEAPYRAVASPVTFSGFDATPGRVPFLGEHTAEVIAQLPRPT